MEQEIYITLRFTLATGKAGLNEIVYSGVNPTNCTKCVRVFRQDHHPV